MTSVSIVKYPVVPFNPSVESTGAVFLVDNEPFWNGLIDNMRVIKSASGRVWITAVDAHVTFLTGALFGAEAEAILAAHPNVDEGLSMLRFDRTLATFRELLTEYGL